MGSASTFRQNDVTRAIRAAKAAGIRPHVWIAGGVIHIEEAGEGQPVDSTPFPVDEGGLKADEAACDEAFG